MNLLPFKYVLSLLNLQFIVDKRFRSVKIELIYCNKNRKVPLDGL